MKGFLRTALALAIINLLVQLVGRKLSRRYSSGGEADDEFRVSAIATGAKFRSSAGALRKGSCRVLNGGAKIDLREAQLAGEGADLYLNAIMGGIRVGVPAACRVELVDRKAFLGGVDLHGPSDRIARDDSPLLRIRANAMLGGIVIGPRP
jgi:hypothetical protein